MFASIGRFILSFLVDKVWALVIAGVLTIWEAFQNWRAKREVEKRIKEMKDAEIAIGDANQIESDEERLRKKMEAACQIERAVNKDADC